MQIILFLASLVLLAACSETPQKEPLTLWYDTPAQNWNEALPIGNGRVGAMIFGGVEKEHLQLNENTLYSGEPSTEYKNVKVKPETRKAVFELLKSGNFKQASDIVGKQWSGRLHQYYQPFGDLYISHNDNKNITSYKRELNISNALAKTTYCYGDTVYEREIFASHPDDLIIIRLKSNKKNSINVSLNFSSIHPTSRQIQNSDVLIFRGQAPGYVERRTIDQIEKRGDWYKYPELFDENGKRKYNHRMLYGDEIDGKGMFFEAQLKPVCPDGKIEISDIGIKVSQTDEVYFLLSMTTSFNGYTKSPSREGCNPTQKASAIIQKASNFDYATLKKRHIADFQTLFNRVNLQLGSSSPEQLALPTDQRIKRFADQNDPDLETTLFQYGRYLMIAGSRPGGQPLNLQGIWNKDSIPGWNCGYTVNINTQMNYWPAEITNLSECHEPLFQLVDELMATGKETAQNMYGMRGWVLHHNTGLWRETYPIDDIPSAAFWPVPQGWLASHLWEHYLFTQDEQFLKEKAYPAIKGAAEFFADWLVEDGKGHLVTPAGISPENWFLSPKGEKSALCIAPTMDIAIIRESFMRTLEIAKKFNIDIPLQKELENKLQLLPPYQIGSKGQLLEWDKEYKELIETQGHVSHLYAFHPSDQITADQQPELFNAVSKSITLRGDKAASWNAAWRISILARLLNGNQAYHFIKNMIERSTYPNMLNQGTIFQIDGNLGYTAGIAEMLLQSHAGYIQVLPAIPDVWTKGSVSGLKARGNFEIDIDWENGKLVKANICSMSGKNCILRSKYPFSIKQNDKTIVTSTPIQSNGKEYFQAIFDTEKGMTYYLITL